MKTAIFISLLFNIIFCSKALKIVSDDDLMNLIRTETYVVTLFSTKNCPTCDNFESILDSLQEEFKSSFEGQTVKVVNSQLTRLYSPTKEPVLVFFRHGIPLIYNNVPSEELIIDTFNHNKEPIVKELNDETFEHLTQAATGATTGDWFIMFYSPDCVDCQRLQARLETVGAQLKSRLSVARVNKVVGGVATASRFAISEVPSFILLKQGKFYRYQIKKYDIASFVSFIQEWYKNMKPERVPLPQSPFDEIINKIVNRIHENPILLQITVGLFGLTFFFMIFAACLKKPIPKDKRKVTRRDDKDK